MKKLLVLSIIMILILGIAGTVFAANLSCKLSLKTEKTQYNKGDEFVVELNVSNIQSDRGLVGINATLDYDKDSLTLVKMEQQNDWSKPSYNADNGKFVMESEPVKANQTVMKITFKVKDTSKQNLTIAVKGITMGDGGAGPASHTDISTAITVKNGTTNSTGNGSNSGTSNAGSNSGNTSTGTTNSGSSSSSKKDNTTASGKIPQTGENTGIIVTIAISSLVVLAIVAFTMIKANKDIIE